MNFLNMELLLYCDFCFATPGERCRTVSHKVASLSHASRGNAAYRIWREGYKAGINHAAFVIDSRCDLDRADLDPRGTLETALRDLREWWPQ